MTDTATVPVPRLWIYGNVVPVAVIGVLLVLLASPQTQVIGAIVILGLSVVGRSITNKKYLALADPQGTKPRYGTKRRILVIVFVATAPLMLAAFKWPGMLAVWYAAVTIVILEVRRRDPVGTGRLE